MNTSVLLIDDNEQFCLSLSRMLSDKDHKISSVLNSNKAFLFLEQNRVDVILLDVRLGCESGIEVLVRLREDYPEIPVIMLSGYASIESAVRSIKLGAFDYIQKPVKYEKLIKLIHNARTMASLQEENKNLKERLLDTVPRIISKDFRIEELKKTIHKLSESNLPILLYGENGTGKEVFADYIFSRSQQKAKKFVKINCAAFPDNLLDNELFGHEKGAYTGADSLYKGVFERAHGGTLFLDEIGDMSLEVQAKVLRVLQNRELYRLGGKDVIRVDVRVISATNKKLEEMMKNGQFREDLFYRLNAAILSIPPLRERRGDISVLAGTFLKEYASVNSKPLCSLSPEVEDLLKVYKWPGNVRELKNVLNYAAAVASGQTIEKGDLPVQVFEQAEEDAVYNPLDDSEKAVILRELQENSYNKRKVAERLNISRTTLYSKMRKYGIG
ncbi:MAG: sigma-54 dependent transcriptional regulator [Spirochaetales bacterium]|nr:sigma-54 dependent transcriptional regulator [Spirochaetales bacterium]